MLPSWCIHSWTLILSGSKLIGKIVRQSQLQATVWASFCGIFSSHKARSRCGPGDTLLRLSRSSGTRLIGCLPAAAQIIEFAYGRRSSRPQPMYLRISGRALIRFNGATYRYRRSYLSQETLGAQLRFGTWSDASSSLSFKRIKESRAVLNVSRLVLTIVCWPLEALTCCACGLLMLVKALQL